MCEYCKNFSKRGSELELNDIFLVEPAKYTFVGDGASYRVPMNFCSNCGRELGQTYKIKRKDASSKRIKVTLLIDEDKILDESGQESINDAISQELMWLQNSGIVVEDWHDA